MYGKHFEGLYHGSMWGAGMAIFAVWGYAIAHANKSRVELNPRELSATLGGTVKEVEEAIEYLTQPDPESRNKEHGGRRMIREGEFQYFLPSWKHYHAIKNSDDLREYNRRKQEECRARKKAKTKVELDNRSRERRSVKAYNAGDDAKADKIAAEDLPAGVELDQLSAPKEKET